VLLIACLDATVQATDSVVNPAISLSSSALRSDIMEKEQQADRLQEENTAMDWRLYIPIFFLIVAVIGIIVLYAKLKIQKKTNLDQHAFLAEKHKLLQTRNDQLKKIYDKLQGSIRQNTKMKTIFENAYAQLRQKLKSQESLQQSLDQAKKMGATLKETNTKLEDTQARLIRSEKMSSLGKLTAGIAHEINNPVNFVANGVNSLKEDFEQINVFIGNYQRICELDTLEEVKKYYGILREDDEDFNDLKNSTLEALGDIEYGTTRITEIVNGLRIFSRQDESDIKEAHINEILEKALLILKPKYKKKAKVLKDLDPSIPVMKCLPGQINQALVNLIGNAADAIDFKGTIHIITKNLDDDNIQIMIKDDGRGMPDDVVEKIFDPFFTTKDVGKGTGLGLSITYGIIEKHHGKIAVDSAEGVGTTFTVTLPKTLKKLKKSYNENII